MNVISIKEPSALNHAVSVLNNLGVLVYPTDTIYGIGGDATSESVIDKINKIKGRSSPMSVLAPSVNIALSWMDIPTNSLGNNLKKLGGATTVIVPVRDNIVHPKILGAGNTLGIRIPDHPFCHSLSNLFHKPIITTSVNRTGTPAKSNPDEIVTEFQNEIDLLINDGMLIGNASTIYIYKDGDFQVLRT